MLLGFKPQFAPFVQEGSKTHTIRGPRKVPAKVGETCHCYVNPRQKSMRLLGRWPCVKIEPIEIYERGDGSFGVLVNGIDLSLDEKAQLAWRDGFRLFGRKRAFDSMMRFWMTTHGNADRNSPFVFSGDIIHWDYQRRGIWPADSMSPPPISAGLATTSTAPTACIQPKEN